MKKKSNNSIKIELKIKKIYTSLVFCILGIYTFSNATDTRDNYENPVKKKFFDISNIQNFEDSNKDLSKVSNMDTLDKSMRKKYKILNQKRHYINNFINIYEPPMKKFKHQELSFSTENWDIFPEEIKNIILGYMRPTPDLKSVCKKFSEFYMHLRINSENYHHLNLELLLPNLYSICFYNSITEDEILDQLSNEEWDAKLSNEEWDAKYIFISNENFKYINKKLVNLKKLEIFNIPFIESYIDSTVPYCYSLMSLSFDFNNSIFSEVAYSDIKILTQFVNLTELDINASILFTEDQEFFSYFINLEILTLKNVSANSYFEGTDSKIFKSISLLKKLATLNVIFGQEPDFISLNVLSSLNSLKNLSVVFDDQLDHEHTIINQKDLSSNLLNNLEALYINNIWLYNHDICSSKLFNIDRKCFFSKYRNLRVIEGNMITFK